MKTIADSSNNPTFLVDTFGRRVDYVRLSVTDRCDFRCVYCMSEDMTFSPRAKLLTLEEQVQLAESLVAMGVKKIRITGGEPLIRHNVIHLFEELGKLSELEELLITTNGSRLKKFALPLKVAGVNRVNISLDTLNPKKFAAITRTGDLGQVLAGIDAAVAQQFDRVKLNAVILKGRNDDEIVELVDFARQRGVDICFIEEMPLGNIAEHDRAESYCSSDEVKAILDQRWNLQPSEKSSTGPSRYYSMDDSTSKIGFISPHSHNFCSSCNRVRVTAEGRLLLCLGNEHSVDLRDIMRRNPNDSDRLKQALVDSMQLKPEKHYFDLNDKPQIVRFMNTTGG